LLGPGWVAFFLTMKKFKPIKKLHEFDGFVTASGGPRRRLCAAVGMRRREQGERGGA
jgi:hypothetical protein